MEESTLLVSYPLPQIEGDEPIFVTDRPNAPLLLCEEGIFTNTLTYL